MTLTEQFSTMIAMTAMGGWIGAALTIYHRFIHPKKRWQWVMILTDILFWMIQGLFVFLILLHVNEGEIRFYIYLALALGFSTYKALIEKGFEKCLEFVIRMIRSTALFIGRAISLCIIQPTFALLKVVYFLSKMVGRIFLMVLLFLLSAIILPLKWVLRLMIPKKWREWVKAFIERSKTFMGKWLRKWK